jgi:hypothetical protein
LSKLNVKFTDFENKSKNKSNYIKNLFFKITFFLKKAQGHMLKRKIKIPTGVKNILKKGFF